ncbi:MAG: cache domain-containing protein, partial [Acidobacteriota bacterium]
MKSISLRILLFAMIVAATVPFLGVTTYSALHLRDMLYGQALNDAMGEVERISLQQDQYLQNTRVLLQTLARMPGVRDGNTPLIEETFRELCSEQYTGFSAVLPNGVVYANYPPLLSSLDLSDREWFREVIATKSFTLSGYIVGRSSGKPIMIAACPVLDSSTNEVRSVIFAALDLDWLAKSLRITREYPDSTITVLDRNGMVLARYPSQAGLAGKPLPEETLRNAIISRKSGSIDIPEGGKDERTYVFNTLGSNTGGAFICVGIPQEAIYQEVREHFLLHVATASLIMAFSLTVVLFGGNKAFVAPIRQLAEMASRLG